MIHSCPCGTVYDCHVGRVCRMMFDDRVMLSCHFVTLCRWHALHTRTSSWCCGDCTKAARTAYGLCTNARTPSQNGKASACSLQLSCMHAQNHLTPACCCSLSGDVESRDLLPYALPVILAAWTAPGQVSRPSGLQVSCAIPFCHTASLASVG